MCMCIYYTMPVLVYDLVLFLMAIKYNNIMANEFLQFLIGAHPRRRRLVPGWTGWQRCRPRTAM